MELIIYKDKPNPKDYSKELLLSLYTDMLKERYFDQSIIRLIAEGTLPGFYHAGSGHEAIPAGVVAHLRQDDYLFYLHRGMNEMVVKGVELSRLYADFFGTIHGTNKGLGAGIIHSADPSHGVMGQPGTIGSNMPIAAGLGFAIKYQRKTDQVVWCNIGDGMSARELLHGAFNWAALKKLPVIFVCQNNEYGLGAHYTEDHALANGYIAERGLSYGIPSYVVDGNNVLAVYEVAKEAVERARKGEGPSFIEARTWRQNGHFVGDPIVYMDKERMKYFTEEYDPIPLFETALKESGMATQEELEAIQKDCKEKELAAIEKAQSYPLPTEDRLYAGLYSTSPQPVTE